MRICAVIPAAGRGSRLGLTGPKLLAPIRGTDTVWTLLSQKLHGVADHIHIIAAPAGRIAIQKAVQSTARSVIAKPYTAPSTSISVQPQPIGMGDAIFRGYTVWSRAEIIVIVWGDQVHVSEYTLRRATELHKGVPRRIVLPLVELAKPYVAYRFDKAKRLIAVLQSREGDICPAYGFSDVGTFVISTQGLAAAWSAYCTRQSLGKRTQEVNFLPFLVFLARCGWDVVTFEVADPVEARGINTLEDLMFFQNLYRG